MPTDATPEPADPVHARLLAAERAARLEAERARAEAEAAAQAKGAFLATMSHELRTPLNAIIGYAELLDLGIFGAVTAAQHDHLDRLRASARHLLGLVNDVLDLAKIDAGRLEMRREVAVTGSAVAAGLALVQPQATAKGVRIDDRHVGEAGVRYVGDEHRVQQILVNLLGNAVKFTPPGGRVTIDCGVTDAPDPDRLPPDSPAHAPGPWAWVRVDDTGPGIAPEFAERLFEPFAQGEASYTRAHGGTGLGLSISRRLARLMRGDLTAGPPSPGGGASFTLWLPADAHDLPPPAAPPAAAPPRAAEPAPALTDAAYAVVHALGGRLALLAEAVSARYVAGLRRPHRPDPPPGLDRLADAHLRDHTTPFVALVASQLMAIGELRGRAPDLLGDGARVQRLMAELHGAQRRRLAWTDAHLREDFTLIAEEIEHALRAAVDADVTAGAAPGAPALPPDPARDDALAYAVDVTRHILERARRASLRAYEAAAPDAAPPDAARRPAG